VPEHPNQVPKSKHHLKCYWNKMNRNASIWHQNRSDFSILSLLPPHYYSISQSMAMVPQHAISGGTNRNNLKLM
jgi:hypothetical protein